MTRGDIIGLVLSYVYAFGMLFGVEAIGKAFNEARVGSDSRQLATPHTAGESGEPLSSLCCLPLHRRQASLPLS
jgi:hypothetical protein